MTGQFRRLLPIMTAVALGAMAWSSVKEKTIDNTAEIAGVKRDVDALKQGFAAQTAILARVENSLERIDRKLNRRRLDD